MVGFGVGTPVTQSVAVEPGSCRDLRILFVQDTGHYELVQTVAGDAWADNGANRWLNEGLAWLSRRCAPPEDQVRVQATAVAGDCSFSVAQCRALLRLWRTTADGTTVELTQKPWAALRNMYGQVPSVVENGTPLYFCRNPRLSYLPDVVLPQDVPEAWYYPLGVAHNYGGSTLYSYGQLGNEAVESYSTFWSLTDNGLRLTPTGDYTSDQFAEWHRQCVLALRFSSRPIKNKLRFKAILPEGVALYVVYGTIVAVHEDQPYVSPHMEELLFTYSESGTEVFCPLPDGSGEQCIFLTFNTEAEMPTSGVLEIVECDIVPNDSLLDDEFLFLPPTSETCFLEGLGSVYAQSLADDGDVTWWTKHHASLVLRAAQMQFERMGMRNEGGARQFEGNLLADCLSIRHMLAAEEMSGPSDQWRIGLEDD